MSEVFKKITSDRISIINTVVSEPSYTMEELLVKKNEINEQVLYYQNIANNWQAELDKIQTAIDGFDVMEIGVEVDTIGVSDLVTSKLKPIMEEDEINF